MNMRIFTSILGVASLSAFSSAALVVNGDFELGNVGFVSDYLYVVPGGTALHPQGVYTVDTNPNNSHGSFANMGDHTTGTGNLMIVNGMAGNSIVWGQTVTGLVPTVAYTFHIYATSVHPASPAQLQLRMDGNSIVTQSLTGTTNQWDLITADFVATATSHTFDVYDLNGAFNGNDFAIDDLAIYVVPEPGAFAAVGLGLVGLVARKRRK